MAHMLALMTNQIREQHQLFQLLHQLYPVAPKDPEVLSFHQLVAEAEGQLGQQQAAEGERGTALKREPESSS